MASLRLKTNDDGIISGLCLDDVESMTTSDGSVTFYADKLYEVNPITGEKVEITPRLIIRNGADVVQVDDYINDKHRHQNK